MIKRFAILLVSMAMLGQGRLSPLMSGFGTLAHAQGAERKLPSAVITVNQGQPLSCLAFTPDGKKLVSASDRSPMIPVWDVASGMEAGQFAIRANNIRSLGFSSDGKMLAAGTDTGEVFLRCFPEAEDWRVFKGHSKPVSSLAFSRDGQWLASAAYYSRNDLNLSADSSSDFLALWARTADEAVRFWNLRTGNSVQLKLQATNPEGLDDVSATNFINFAVSDRFLLYGGPTRNLGARMLDRKSDTVASHFQKRRVAMMKPLRSRDVVAVLSVNADEMSVHFWQPDSGEEHRRTRLSEARFPRTMRALDRIGPALPFSTVDFSPDGLMMITGGGDGIVRIWDVLSGEDVYQLTDHATAIRTVAFSNDGRTFASGGVDAQVRIWNLVGMFGDPATKTQGTWQDLTGKDVAKAFRAQWRCVADPDRTLRELRRRWQPAPDKKRVARLISDLNCSLYKVRAGAAAELKRIGPGVMSHLADALKNVKVTETRRRLERLLRELTTVELAPENLWKIRAVTILEQIDAGEARRQLNRLADGEQGLLLMREAGSALKRIGERENSP